MALHDTPRPAPFGAITVFRLIRLLNGGVEALQRWTIARKTDATLRQLTDQQLHDIGLSRGWIEEVSTQVSARR